MKIRILFGIAYLLLLAAGAALCQAPAAAPTYTPTEVQSLRLQVKQKDTIIAYNEFMRAQQTFQAAQTALLSEGDKVKKENKWPDEVTFHGDTLTFTPPPAAAKPPKAPQTPPATSGAKSH